VEGLTGVACSRALEGCLVADLAVRLGLVTQALTGTICLAAQRFLRIGAEHGRTIRLSRP
jgi:hypothetical protein